MESETSQAPGPKARAKRRDPEAVERFVQMRARPGSSNGKAAIAAGLTANFYSARVIGCKLMKDPEVRSRVHALRAEPPGLLVAVVAPSVGLTRFAFAPLGDTDALMLKLGVGVNFYDKPVRERKGSTVPTRTDVESPEPTPTPQLNLDGIVEPASPASSLTPKDHLDFMESLHTHTLQRLGGSQLSQIGYAHEARPILEKARMEVSGVPRKTSELPTLTRALATAAAKYAA